MEWDAIKGIKIKTQRTYQKHALYGNVLVIPKDNTTEQQLQQKIEELKHD